MFEDKFGCNSVWNGDCCVCEGDVVCNGKVLKGLFLNFMFKSDLCFLSIFFFFGLLLVFFFVIMVLIFCVMVYKFEMFWYLLFSYGKIVLLVLKKYVVIFDVGSFGSWIYIYCFDLNYELVKVGNELEIFMYLELGLSDFVKDF